MTMATRTSAAILTALALNLPGTWAAELSGSVPNPLTTTYTVGGGNWLSPDPCR